jgi:hypothetical protein
LFTRTSFLTSELNSSIYILPKMTDRIKDFEKINMDEFNSEVKKEVLVNKLLALLQMK